MSDAGTSVLTEPGSRLLEAALAYAELGYRVFPCARGSKKPLTEHGFHDATTDPARIEAWWTRHPDANVAIATEGLVVIDRDGADNPWPGDAERMLDLGRSPTSDTPRGGLHHYFKQPPGKSWRCSMGRLAPGVDVRAEGGYTLLPPSVTSDGVYRWRETMELDCGPDNLPEPPGWLAELLDAASAQGEPRTAVAAGNIIPEGQRNGSLARLAGTMRRAGMTEAEILAALLRVNQDRCRPPLASPEVQRVAASIARYEPDQVTVALIEDHFAQDFQSSPEGLFVPAARLCQEHRTMREPVIVGLLREGETMNVIASPKTGKSWLVLNLGLSVAAGRPWLDFPTVRGRVLLVDNELHPETLANRIPRVAEAMGLSVDEVSDDFCVQTLRGRLADLYGMDPYFRSLPPNRFKLVILDAFYRFIPKETHENDNGTMANLYNLVDRWAARLEAAFVLIHHTTKGSQADKGVTDVGAGAGAQSRAADCHFILRPHAEDGCYAVEAVARSWPSPEPFVIRKTFPLWTPELGLDPADLRRPGRPSRKRQEEPARPPAPKWTVEEFVGRFIGAEPRSKAAVLAAANEAGLSDYRAARLLGKAEARGLVHRHHLGGNRPGFACVPEERADDKRD